MDAVLKIKKGPGRGLRYSLPEGATLRVGRAPENDIVLDDAAISRIHCVFRNESGVCLVKDMGGVNGTQVNGKLVRNAIELNPGDTIVIGKKTLVQFQRDQEPSVGARATQPIKASGRKRAHAKTPAENHAAAHKEPAAPDAEDEPSSFVVPILLDDEAETRRPQGLFKRLFGAKAEGSGEPDSPLLRLFIRQWRQGKLYALGPGGARVPFQDLMDKLVKPQLMELDVRDGGTRGIRVKFSAPVAEMELRMGPDGKPVGRKVVEAEVLERLLPPGDRAQIRAAGPHEVVSDEGLEENPAVRRILEDYSRLSVTVHNREMYINLTRQEFAKFANIPRCHRYELMPIQESL